MNERDSFANLLHILGLAAAVLVFTLFWLTGAIYWLTHIYITIRGIL